MKTIKKILKYGSAAIALVCVVLTGVVEFKKHSLERDLAAKTDIHNSGGIQLLEEWTVNGNRQWVSIRGQDQSNPIVLMVHGGPGSADLSLGRYMDFEVEKEFVVVRWDQRNAGKSYSFFGGAGNLTPELFIADLHDLVGQIKTRFSRQKIFIAGHSWGSLISAIAVHRYPEDFYAYIGVGQFVSGADNEKYSYEFTLREAEKEKNEAALRELQEIGPPPYELKATGVQRKWLNYYGGGMFFGAHRHDSYDYFGQMMFACPEYSLVDDARFFAGVASSLIHLWPQVARMDLAHEATEFKVPVYLMLGRHDYNTPTEVARRYLAAVKAPKKEIVWFENSAHAPNYEQPEDFGRALAKIKAETMGSVP